MKNCLPSGVMEIAACVSSPVYVVGGFVRDFFLGFLKEGKDIDICGAAGIEEFKKDKRFSVIPVNELTGTFLIVFKGQKYEYTPLRSEAYGDGGGHTPQSVIFHDDVRADALRRDFTCNSIYYDIKNDKILDFFGGVSDIKNKLLRAENPDFTFSSDGLRILRAVRFAAELGFGIEDKTAAAIKKSAHLLEDISGERKRAELDKILCADLKNGIAFAQYKALDLLRGLDILPHFIPELKALDGFKQNPKYHKYDVLEHTFQTVKYARPDIRLAALLHDIGKPESVDEHGHMPGHNLISERIARRILGQSGLKYSLAEIEETARLCRLHMYDLKGDTSASKMRLFVAENFDIIDKVAALRDADGMGAGFSPSAKFNRFLKFRQDLIDDGAPVTVKQLRISGAKLVELGIEPHKRAQILKELLRDCIINPNLNNEEWLLAQALRLSTNA